MPSLILTSLSKSKRQKLHVHSKQIKPCQKLKQLQAILRANEIRFQIINQQIKDFVFIMDKAGNILYAPPGSKRLFGFSSEEMLGQNFKKYVEESSIPIAITAFQHLFIKKHNNETLILKMLKKDGSGFFGEVNGTYYDDGLLQGLLVALRDVTEKHVKEQQLQFVNCHDSLTQLYNRTFFEKELVRLDIVDNLPFSVIMGDINGLRLANDIFGHPTGDRLIVQVAEILKKSCRKSDVITRVGGDEFNILLPKTDIHGAKRISERILHICENAYIQIDKTSYHASISLGYATKTDQAQSIQQVLKNAEDMMYNRKLLEQRSMHSSLISSIRTTLFEKNHDTKEHADRLVSLAKAIGQKLSLPENQMCELELLSTLHDIGKISVDDHILNKAGKLTLEEWIEIRKHPEVGYKIACASPELYPIASSILSHHERWDGTGYPQGLSGTDIPLLARIIAVVDAYDAMTNDRPYRKALSEETAISELRKNAGKQFDKNIVKIFVEIISPSREKICTL